MFEVRSTNPYVYLESLSLGEHHEHVYMATSLPYLKKKKKAKNVTFARKCNGATDLKSGMQTQLDSANNMGLVPSGHTFFSSCVRLKCQNCTSKKYFDLITCSLLF